MKALYIFISNTRLLTVCVFVCPCISLLVLCICFGFVNVRAYIDLFFFYDRWLLKKMATVYFYLRLFKSNLIVACLLLAATRLEQLPKL